MKRYLKIGRLFGYGFIIASISIFQSCKDEIINIQGETEESFQTAELAGQIIGKDGKLKLSNFDFQTEGNYSFAIQLNKVLSQAGAANISYDASVLNNYNKDNGTSYKAYPKELISFDKNGAINIPANSNLSENLKITIKSNSSATPQDVFVLPIKATSNVLGGSSNLEYLLFIKDLTKGASATKENGLQVFSIIEANNVNPLMNLAFTLKNSGKPLFDHVVLFSSNININASTGRVYINHNENLTHILNNRDKYIKPLQDRGIKVHLSLLGNHDLSGIANLSDETIKYFAQEVKNTVETYGLDGVFYDDEYSAYQYSNLPPGFVSPSNQRAAKLLYEIKKALPHSMNLAYVYSRTGNFGPTWWGDINGINEAQAGEYVDYAVHDYNRSFDLTNYYPGLPKNKWIMRSSEHARNFYESIDGLRTIRANGQGGTMVFSLNPHYTNWSLQLSNLENIASALYDEELVYDESKAPRKDW